MTGTSPDLVDVERFRAETRRVAVVRTVACPTVVLGSTQDPGLVPAVAAQASGSPRPEVVRRRSGGGAVWLSPGDQLWIDTWIPRHDPLWVVDVSVAAEWAGVWWRDALAAHGLAGLEVHRGRAEPGALGALVCFAGRGPGEVFAGGRKVVGLAQWRAREGALFSSCAYARWEPARLAEALAGGDGLSSVDLRRRLAGVAVGLDEVVPPVGDLGELAGALLDSLASQ